MAGLSARVAARGFPAAGYPADQPAEVAAAALAAQGGTADPAHGVRAYGTSPSTLHGFALEGPGPVGAEVLGDIPGPGTATDPDQTPGYGPGTFRTHAAPRPGHAGSYAPSDELDVLHENSRNVHSQDFGGQRPNRFQGIQPPGGDILPMEPWHSEDYGDSNQAPLTGTQRVLGGFDAVQGYGGGGTGPGGVNGHGFGAVKINRLGITGNVVNAYLDPAERPFIVPQGSGSYIPTDAVTGPEPFTSMLAADGIAYHDPTTYVPPPDTGILDTPLTAATAWGW